MFELIQAARRSEAMAECTLENQRLINTLYLPLSDRGSVPLINNVHVDIELLKTPARILGLVLPQSYTAHPEESIVYRSICPQVYPEWFAELKSSGFKVVFSRQVYLLDAPGGAHRRKRALDIDSRLAAKQKHLCWTLTRIISVPTIWLVQRYRL